MNAGNLSVIFGMALDQASWPLPAGTEAGVIRTGPRGLLSHLEHYLGLSGYRNDVDYLRIEQYRQVAQQLIAVQPDCFFAASFAADQFATAADLLARRDELLLAGWDFLAAPTLPPRLLVLARMEQLIAGKTHFPLYYGFADRFRQVFRLLPERRLPIGKVELVTPRDQLPHYWQALLARMEAGGVAVQEALLEAEAAGDLGVFQDYLRGRTGRGTAAAGDGSLILVKGKRDTDLAQFLAKVLRNNPDLSPCLLIPTPSGLLDQHFIQEGLPAMGIPSPSLARPTLQILKLATAFLWEPVDPYQLMEFVSLSIKPLERELANRIARQLAQSPGIQGEQWQAMLGRYFGDMERKNVPHLDRIRFQYRFWFERRRYDTNAPLPKIEALEIFRYLQRWAREEHEERNLHNHSLFTLSEQARQVAELLETLPEETLTRLELERIVRTIYEAAPVVFRPQEKGSYPYVHHPAAITAPIDRLVWWNFSQQEPDYFFSRWFRSELAYLRGQSVLLDDPALENARLIRDRKHPFLSCSRQVILVQPETIRGEEAHPHPLAGNLEACFGGTAPFTFDIESPADRARLQGLFAAPQRTPVAFRRLGRPQPFILFPYPQHLAPRDYETLTSLEALFYYPYQWVFRYKLQLRQSSILSIVPEPTLMGNLAHRVFEKLLQQPELTTATRQQVERWVDTIAAEILQREGTVLLLYGREPERIGFIRKLKFSAWSLTDLLQRNGWQVAATEQEFEGRLQDIPVRGRADLLLVRENEQAVIDLKWRGLSRRTNMIRNGEDLQLVLYARLASGTGSWAHTGYYIMEKGQMLARTNHAFLEINPISPDQDPVLASEEILQRMQATFRWRRDQLANGLIEVRCTQTRDLLDEHYDDLPLDLLEMRTDDAPYDEYRTLINLVD